MDAWREEYNTCRPHQSLDMASPADRFRAAPRSVLPLWVPGELAPVGTELTEQPEQPAKAIEPPPAVQVEQPAPVLDLTTIPAGAAVEVERTAPVCGNLTVGPQQFWLGGPGRDDRVVVDRRPRRASEPGRPVLQTLPSRFTSVDLARLRANGARTAGPPPARPSIVGLAGNASIEVERVVNGCRHVALAGHTLPVGSPLAGRQVIPRIEEHLVHVITDGQIWKTVSPAKRARLRGAYLPAPNTEPVRVQRRGSSRGGIQVVSQRVQVGLAQRHTIVNVEIDETVLRLFNEHDTLIKVVPRTSRKEVSRYKAYARQDRAQASPRQPADWSLLSCVRSQDRFAECRTRVRRAVRPTAKEPH